MAKKLTPQQQAARIAAGIVNPQVSAYNAQIKAAQQEEDRKYLAAQGIGQAISQASAHVPGDIESAYARAAQATAGFGSMVTGRVGELARATAQQMNANIQAAGAPGSVTSDFTPDQQGGMNTVYGMNPASDLRSEGANQFASAAQLNATLPYAWGQTALAASHSNDPAINQLRAQSLAVQGTRGAEAQKALLAIQDAARQNEALAIQKKQAERAWLNTLTTQALNETNLTGRLHVVKNGRVVDTGQPAAGSTAAVSGARIQSAEQIAAAKLRYQAAQDRIQNTIDAAKLGISQQQADAATRREAAYAANLKWHQQHPNAKATGKNNPGGLSDSVVKGYRDQAGKFAYTLFNGEKNANFDPNNGVPGQKGYTPDPKNPYYSTKPSSAAEAMTYLLTFGIPYTIAWNAVKRLAQQPHSHWIDALSWNKQPAESPGGPGKK